jgi:hypothetical protein
MQIRFWYVHAATIMPTILVQKALLAQSVP